MRTYEGYRRFKGAWQPSAAERRVLDELVSGHTNAEIAVRLGLSPETVKSHVARLLAETGSADRATLARWWRERPARPPLLIPALKWAARVAAVVAALGVGIVLLVAGGRGAAHLASALRPARAPAASVIPPELPPATPATPIAPTPQPGVALPVQFLWEADGGAERLRGVRTFALDAAGNAYVQDAYNHRIVKFGPDGRVLTRWGGAGDGPGQFNFLRNGGTEGYPGAIAVAPDGTVWVADDSGRVQRFDPDGRYLGEWARRKGTGPGQLDYPGNMTFDRQGHIWLNGGGEGHLFQVFDRDGTLLAAWGRTGTGPGEFDRPGAPAFAPDGTIYVSDSWNHRVQRLDAAGRYLGEFGGRGDGPGQFNVATGIAVDAEGNVYVGDNRGGHRVQKFDPAGRYLGEFGGRGARPGQFNMVGQVRLDGQGNIYVADQFNNRIQKFRLP